MKLAHRAVKYGHGEQDGEHCGACIHWRKPHCNIVQDPMPYGAMGWCDRFKSGAGAKAAVKRGKMTQEQYAKIAGRR